MKLFMRCLLLVSFLSLNAGVKTVPATARQVQPVGATSRCLALDSTPSPVVHAVGQREPHEPLVPPGHPSELIEEDSSVGAEFDLNLFTVAAYAPPPVLMSRPFTISPSPLSRSAETAPLSLRS